MVVGWEGRKSGMVKLLNIRFISALSAAALLSAGCGDQRDAADVSVLKVTTVLPIGHPSSQALQFFEERVETLSNGRIDVKVFFSGQLGSAVETVELCRGGNVEIINCASSYVTQFRPIFKVLEMPFIFRDSTHQHAVLDGPVGEELKMEFSSTDLKLLAFFDAGSRNIMTKKGPVTTPDQLSGMKIRVMPSPLLLSAINAIGASAIPMNQGEVYSALQMGVLDGWENNPPTALNFRMYETGCIYYTRTGHSCIPDLLLMSERSFGRLSSELQSVILMAASEAQARQRELWKVAESAAEEQLASAGMIFTKVDRSLFKARINGVYEDMYKRYGVRFKSLCTRIQEETP